MHRQVIAIITYSEGKGVALTYQAYDLGMQVRQSNSHRSVRKGRAQGIYLTTQKWIGENFVRLINDDSGPVEVV